MKPTKQLILALRETASRIRSGQANYRWTSVASCNCGLLAKTLLNVDNTWLLENLPGIATWSCMAQDAFCTVTGIPTNTVFKALYDAGVEKQDFTRIEFLLSPRVPCGCDDPVTVAAWMDAEAERLEILRKNTHGT